MPVTAKVLVADDSLFMRTLLKGILQERKFEVLEAKNGIEAADMYDKHRPDLVTLDIVMPQQDGLAALKRIKSMDPGASVIMISSNGHDTNVTQALSDGAVDFIQKPFAGAEVCSKIGDVLKRSSKIAN